MACMTLRALSRRLWPTWSRRQRARWVLARKSMASTLLTGRAYKPAATHIAPEKIQ